MSAFTEPLAQVREALEVLYRLLAAKGADVKPYNVGEDALARVERLAAEQADILAGFLHDADNGDIPGKGLRDMARAVLSAREEGAA